ncbi:hypothetical protein VZT92_026421 [Zoarces viviparus]|uniref:B30.2/SPRY domain-containing protein n=2 Tax=Zoarces viviparus TaxID=48416 RepID=A0AAW1DZT3_ZOAVI
MLKFVWKEMLQVIQPRAELLSLTTNRADITVSDDGRSLFCTPKSEHAPSGHSSAFGTNVRSVRIPAFIYPATFGQHTTLNLSSTAGSEFNFGLTAGSGQTAASSIISHVFNEFTSGQHYWETEVGLRDYWALGIKDYFLNYDGQKYSTCSPKATTELALGARPRKIGIYLNCSSKKLSFYDADNMTHIDTLSAGLMSTPLSAQFNIRVAAPDRNPLTVCWY